MNKFFKDEKIKNLVVSCLLILVGILFCFVPNTSVTLIETILSAILIIAGLLFVLAFCFAPSDTRNFVELVEGCVLLIFGFLISVVSSLFILFIGIILLLLGARDIYFCIKTKQTIEKNKFKTDLTFGIICAVLGLVVIILWCTNLAKSVAIIVLGVFLLINGITKLIFAIRVLNLEKKKQENVSRFDGSQNKNSDNVIKVEADIKTVETEESTDNQPNEKTTNSEENSDKAQTPDDFKDFDVK